MKWLFMLRRFFSSRPIRPPHAEISGSEAHHILHVLRLKEGDQVLLFDGTGVEYTARIEAISRQKVQCVIEGQQDICRELGVEIHLAVAFPKGDRSRWLIEKAVELGVHRIVPLESERSVVHIRPASLSRLNKAVVEASKQCGRNQLMEIGASVSFLRWLEQEQGDALQLIAHPEANGHPLHSISDFNKVNKVRVAIGPEGGFSASEVRDAVAKDWKLITLGDRLLRVETAALAVVASIGSWIHSEKRDL
jgi:16S rRNA (uracil1498-N3)-methyltransferase